MAGVSKRWAVVLAAGSGTRLSGLTRAIGGVAVPKQFCSLDGGPSLLEETLERAQRIAPAERIVVVVAADQRAYWSGALSAIPRANLIVQPCNRGTANGILLGISAVLRRAPDAAVVVLPSDHYVEREDVLCQAVEGAFGALGSVSRRVVFLGIEPEAADPELGYILPAGADSDGSHRIARFVEKPAPARAARLLAQGALWNSFILVARAEALAELVGRQYPEVVAAFRALPSAGRRAAAIELMYRTLPEIDFSRHVVEGADAPLRVVPVPSCGWSDLGTPARVSACLDRLDRPLRGARTLHPNLAEACARAAEQPAPARLAV